MSRMRESVQSDAAFLVGNGLAGDPQEGDLVAEERDPPVQFPSHQTVVVHVTGGLDGVLRVVALLRGRSYKVRDVDVEIREGVVESRVGCTVFLTTNDAELLLARLRRMPVVVSAERGSLRRRVGWCRPLAAPAR